VTNLIVGLCSEFGSLSVTSCTVLTLVRKVTFVVVTSGAPTSLCQFLTGSVLHL